MLNTSSNLVLGSGSPRRRRLLEEYGYSFDVLVADSEEVLDSIDPVGTVINNALSKNLACRKLAENSRILTADTLVWFEGKLVGKPTDKDEAYRYLNAFSGKNQTVFTGVVYSYIDSAGKLVEKVRCEASLVKFKELNEEYIRKYIELVNPLDRAGAYDISDHGDLVVEKIIGSRSNVIGLPMEIVVEMIDKNLN